MGKHKPQPLSYASPDLQRSPWIEKAGKLFWPIVAIVFIATVMLEAGVGWAAAVYQLLTSGLLLAGWLLAAYGWGAIPWNLLRLPRRDALALVTILAMGLGTLSLLILGLGLVGAMNQFVTWGLIAVGWISMVLHLLRVDPGDPANPGRRFALPRRVDFSVDLVHYCWLLIVPLAGITITCAMLPAGFLWGADEPNGYDVVGYHLQVPREWFELGKIVPLHHNVFSFFPFNVEMHYLFAMHLMGGPWVAQFLAQMMHAAFIGLSVAAVYTAVAERGRFVAIMAALLAASAPWMPMLGSIAYNEGGLLLYGTLAIAWALRAMNWLLSSSDRRNGTGLMRLMQQHTFILAGLMAGFACGCKLTGVPLLLIGIPVAMTAVILLRGIVLYGVSIKRLAKSIALFLFAGLLVFSPWLIRNYAWAGNPVFPEQQKLLGRGHFSQEQSDRFYKAHKTRPDQQAMTVRVAELWRQVFADWRFGYALLPIGGLAILLSLRRTESHFLLFMLLGLTAFWLLMTHLQGRFYVLAIPIVAIGVSQVANNRLPILFFTCAALLTISGTGYVVLQSHKIFNRNGFDLRQAIGYADYDLSVSFKDQFLPSRHSPIVLVGGAQVFFFHTPMSQLQYRTVFDVDTKHPNDAIAAWTVGIAPGSKGYLWIDLVEVERLHRTYGTPLLPPSTGAYQMSNPFGMPFTAPPAP